MLSFKISQMPGNILQEIHDLRTKANNAQRMYEQTKFFAEKALNMSVDAYEQALALYTEANAVQLPGVDVEQLLAESNRIKEEVGITVYPQWLEHGWLVYRDFFQSLQNSFNSSRKQIFRDFFSILSWNCMLCVLIRIASSRGVHLIYNHCVEN